MPRYEYKVVPAPTKGQKSKDTKTAEGRFALSVEGVLNEMGALGWDYLRAELLPSEERTGLAGTATNWRNVLVFRRLLAEDESPAPLVHPARASVMTQMAKPATPGPMPSRPVPVGPAVTTTAPAPAPAQDGDEADIPEDGKPGDDGIDDEITGAETDPEHRTR